MNVLLSAEVDRLTEVIASTFEQFACLFAGGEDESMDWVPEFAEEYAREWCMAWSALAVMADWTQPTIAEG